MASVATQWSEVTHSPHHNHSTITVSERKHGDCTTVVSYSVMRHKYKHKSGEYNWIMIWPDRVQYICCGDAINGWKYRGRRVISHESSGLTPDRLPKSWSLQICPNWTSCLWILLLIDNFSNTQMHTLHSFDEGLFSVWTRLLLVFPGNGERGEEKKCERTWCLCV